jgi:hypothetical protein
MGGEGGYGFFLIKYSDSPCCWKKYSDVGGGKIKSDSECLSYIPMLNTGKTLLLQSWKKTIHRTNYSKINFGG